MSNPILQAERFEMAREREGQVMTVKGAATKTLILMGVLLTSLAMTWQQVFATGTVFGLSVPTAMMAGSVTALVAVLVSMFSERLIVPIAFIYALAKGVALGAITLFFNEVYPGLPMVAAAATATTFVGVLMLYQMGIVRNSPMFSKIVMGSVVGVMLFSAFAFIMGFFGMSALGDAIFGSGMIGIGFSLFCVVLGAAMLVMDFDFIERGAASQQPKRVEWIGAFGLLITLVWLYINMLQLLAKLNEE